MASEDMCKIITNLKFFINVIIAIKETIYIRLQINDVELDEISHTSEMDYTVKRKNFLHQEKILF